MEEIIEVLEIGLKEGIEVLKDRVNLVDGIEAVFEKVKDLVKRR